MGMLFFSPEAEYTTETTLVVASLDYMCPDACTEVLQGHLRDKGVEVINDWTY